MYIWIVHASHMHKGIVWDICCLNSRSAWWRLAVGNVIKGKEQTKTYLYIYIYMYTCVYVYVYICMCVHIYIYVVSAYSRGLPPSLARPPRLALGAPGARRGRRPLGCRTCENRTDENRLLSLCVASSSRWLCLYLCSSARAGTSARPPRYKIIICLCMCIYIYIYMYTHTHIYSYWVC